MTLVEIRDRMVQILGHPEKLSFVNARLVLRTGISLTHLDAQPHTTDDVARVMGALRDMGYSVDVPPSKS